MFSTSSWQNSVMTSRESIPSGRKQPGQLVGEGDLGGVEGVAGVLQRLGDPDLDDLDRLVKEAEQPGHRLADGGVWVPTMVNGGA